jgi:hypothetical protein
MLAILLTALALNGCNGGATTTGDTGPGDSGLPGDSSGDTSPLGDAMDTTGGVTGMVACTQLAMARCARLDACSNNTGVARVYGSMNTCVSQLTANCLAALMVPMTTASPSFEQACAAAVTAQSCSDFRSGLTAPGCVAPMGPLANGMPCVANGQCASTVCLVPRNAQCGVCGAVPAVGADCSVNANCGHTLVCNRNAVTLAETCQMPVAAGGTCDGDHPCAGGLGCVRASATVTSGTCTAFATMVGATCNVTDVGMATCDAYQGLFCNNMNQCAMSTAAMVGQACGPMMMRMSDAVCQGAAYCQPAAMAGGMRTCAAASMDGQPCDTSSGPDCFPPSRCVLGAVGADAGTSGTCRAFDPAACH